MGRRYEFKFRNADGVKNDAFFEANMARNKFIKDNNITFKEKTIISKLFIVKSIFNFLI